MICSSLCRVPFMAVLLSWVWENSHSRRSSFRGLRHLQEFRKSLQILINRNNWWGEYTESDLIGMCERGKIEKRNS
jgi:hypothetical protein